MRYRIKIIDESSKQVLIMSAESDELWAVQNGYTTDLYDVEQGYNGNWYLTGHAPNPTTAELAERVRSERNRRITYCDWVITRHRDELDEGGGTALTTNEYAAWLTYRKALRNLPSVDGFPWDGGAEETPWPSEPAA